MATANRLKIFSRSQAYSLPLSGFRTVSILLVLAVGISLVTSRGFSFAPKSPVRAAARTNTTPISHIIFIVKENRSFDSMFGTFPGAGGATTYLDPQGNIHPLNHQPDSLLNDIDHTHSGYVKAYDHGKLDKFSLLKGAMQNGKDEADSQLYQSDLPNYWAYANTFTLADTFFSTVSGPTFPNHLFTIAGQDASVDGLPKFPTTSHPLLWGCDDPAGTTVEQRFPNGSTQYVFPCFDFPTLADLLDPQNISWKYYVNLAGSVLDTYDAIQHIRYSTDWTTHRSNWTNFVSDATSGKLPTVSWLLLPFQYSEHAPHSVCKGENETVQQINAVMGNASLWASTAIILAWDDFGGFYDHVPPPPGPNPQIEYGARIPAILISPYAKPGYIDHTMYSFPSMLKFTEDVLGLPPLTSIDPNSIDGQMNDMFNAFNFQQTPIPPLKLRQRTCPAFHDNATPQDDTD